MAKPNMISGPEAATNVLQFEVAARQKLESVAYDFLAGGADDMKTLRANSAAFDEWQIRVRRLVDVSTVDTSIELFGETFAKPVFLAPVGFQRVFNPDGELAVARGAAARNYGMIVSTLSSFTIERICKEYGAPVWFQLYPTPDRNCTRELLHRAEEAGCQVLALATDLPAVGNREEHRGFIENLVKAGDLQAPNLAGTNFGGQLQDPAMDWKIIEWLRANTSFKLLLKGIVTHEDAALAVEHGVDGLIVSNHGGRQEESNRATLECLPEVVEAIDGRIPVLMDGGIRRGTDVFKALALGADAVCVGRPYLWGLAAFGQPGVERVLEILHEELIRIMQLAGTTSIAGITRAFVTKRERAF